MEFTRKPDNNETKLSLRRESLRELTTADLQQVAGGATKPTCSGGKGTHPTKHTGEGLGTGKGTWV